MPRNKRGQPEIDASSMADIAFLLLVFWLSITTVLTVQGLPQKLEKEKVQQEVIEEQEQEINAQYLLVIQQKGSDICDKSNLNIQIEYAYIHDGVSGGALDKELREGASMVDEYGKDIVPRNQGRSIGKKIVWENVYTELEEAQLTQIKDAIANHIRKQEEEHIIQFKYKSDVCYQAYMTMFQTIEAAYEEVRNEKAMEMFGLEWSYIKAKAKREEKTKEGNKPGGFREMESTIYKLVSTSKLSKQTID